MKIPSTFRLDNDDDRARWEEQNLRYRLLNGEHMEDVRDEITAMFASEIAADLTINPDLSRNPFLLIWQQLNVAYLEPPTVTTDDPEDDLTPVVTPRLWAQMQETALYALAMGECLIRLDFRHWAEETEVTYRTVAPGTVVLEAMSGQPEKLGKVTEYRPRDGAEVTRDIWDVRDPAAPIFRIEALHKGQWVDATARYAPDLVGQYPYRDRELRPILPYILKHSRVTSQLWSWTRGREVSAGALRLAALFTHWGDGFTSAAYPQRYAVDLDSPGGVTRTVGGQSVETVTVDRKSILKFSSKGPGGGSLGQFQAAMDPLAAIEALKVYEQGLAVYAGLNPSDLQVTQAQSGYAIVVSRAGQRRAQKKAEPAFRLSDQELLATAARLSNFYTGGDLPEDPRAYAVTYHALKLSPGELKELAESLKARMELGAISQIEAVRELRPEIESDEEAVRALIRVRQLEAELEALAATEQDI